MTKIKLTVTVEKNGREFYQTQPEFLFGFKEELDEEQLIELAEACLRDLTGALHKGVRVYAPSGMKIWPQEG